VNARPTLSAGIPQSTEAVGAVEHKVRRRFEVPPLRHWSPRSRGGLIWTAYRKPVQVKENLCGLKGQATSLTRHFPTHLGDLDSPLRRTEHQGLGGAGSRLN
jgi:hypothetical protein